VPAVHCDPKALGPILKLQRNGSAPGPSGWSGDLLSLLGHDDTCLQSLSVLVQDIMNGLVPDAIRPHLLACKLIGIPKPNNGVRPIAMAEPLVKLSLHYASSRTNNAIVDILAPHQFGVGVVGGVERAIHKVQNLLETGPQHNVAVLVDFHNAFNNMFRDVALAELFSHPELSPLWSAAHFAYHSPTPLFVFDQDEIVDTIMSATGSRQGCKLGSTLFCLGLRGFLRAAQAQAPDVHIVAICDDVTLVGPVDSCMKVFDWMRENSQRLTGLTVNTSKTKILSPTVARMPESIEAAAVSRSIPLAVGQCALLGSVVGLDEPAKKKWVLNKIKEIQPKLQRLLHPGVKVQSALLLLRSSINAVPNFLFRTLPPDLTREAAEHFTAMVLETLCTKLDIPKFDQLPRHAQLSISLPVNKGGLGLTIASQYLDVGYLSACAGSIQDNFMSESGHHLLVNGVPAHGNHAHTLTRGHIESTLSRLARDGVDTDHKVMPATVAGMIDAFKTGVPRRLQHTLSMSVQKQQFKLVQELSSADQHWAARLRSASAPGAHHWLTTLPTHQDTVLTCSHTKLAIRLLMGLRPDDATKAVPPCRFCKKPMQDDPWHPLHCNFESSHGKSTQHNQIRDKLWEFCNEAGLGNARREASEYQQPCHVRPDLVVTFPNGVHTIDVSGTDPCAPSLVTSAARRTLSAASKREQTKNAAYARLVTMFGHQFSPFVFETHGGLGVQAMEFIDKLCLHASDRPGFRVQGQFRYHLLSALSVIIQTANAQFVSDHYQQCRVAAGFQPGNPLVVGGQ